MAEEVSVPFWLDGSFWLYDSFWQFSVPALFSLLGVVTPLMLSARTTKRRFTRLDEKIDSTREDVSTVKTNLTEANHGSHTFDRLKRIEDMLKNQSAVSEQQYQNHEDSIKSIQRQNRLTSQRLQSHIEESREDANSLRALGRKVDTHIDWSEEFTERVATDLDKRAEVVQELIDKGILDDKHTRPADNINTMGDDFREAHPDS